MIYLRGVDYFDLFAVANAFLDRLKSIHHTKHLHQYSKLSIIHARYSQSEHKLFFAALSMFCFVCSDIDSKPIKATNYENKIVLTLKS